MSDIGYGSALNLTKAKAGLILEAELSTPLSAFVGTEDTSAFVLEDRAGATRGSTFNIRFTAANRNEAPKGAGDPTVGSESTEAEYEDSVALRYLKYDGKVENYILEQGLVDFDRKAQVLSRLALQWAYLDERTVFNQLVGNTLVNTGYTDYGFSGGNIVTAQDANHIYYCPDGSGANTTDAQVAGDATSVLDTHVIDDLVTRATSTAWVDWPMVPADTPFGPLYILICHGTGFQQIKENSTGSDMYDLSKAAIQGGLDLSMSPLITGEGFIYGKTLVLRSDFAPQGITTGAAQANTRCAAFFGARAGHWMYGESFSDGDHLGYSEHVVHRRLSILTDTVRGFKRTIVNGTSWSSFRVVHYSAV